MKKLLLTLVVALISSATYAQETEYLITGTAPKDANWVHFFLNGQFRRPDSVAVKDGKFQINGKKPIHTFITVATNQSNDMTIISDGTPVTIDLNNRKVTGSAENIQFANLQKDLKDKDAKMMEIFEQYKAIVEDKTVEAETKKETFKKQMNDLEEEQVKEVLKYTLSHQQSVTPAFYLAQMYYGLDYGQLNQVLDTKAAYYNHPMMDTPKRQHQSLAKRRAGLTFTDLSMNDLEGKPVKLSQWVGKGNYVLVDFWASWCGPCRMEMPHVVDAYKRYHEAKGFNVVAVSFDSKQEAWKKGVEDLQMPWPQMSDLKGWKCAAAEIYGINSIPSNILVNPQGKIIASDLRGDGLATKLKEIYGY